MKNETGRPRQDKRNRSEIWVHRMVSGRIYPQGDHQIFSYFTDPAIMPVFKAILISMLRTVEEYLERYQCDCEEVSHCKGQC